MEQASYGAAPEGPGAPFNKARPEKPVNPDRTVPEAGVPERAGEIEAAPDRPDLARLRQ